VGGVIFTTLRSTLRQFPNTLLGDNKRIEKFYDNQRELYILNRDAQVFSLILSFYQSGGRYMYRPPTISIETFVEEILYFDLFTKYQHGPRIGLRDGASNDLASDMRDEIGEKKEAKKKKTKTQTIAEFLKNPSNTVSCTFAFVSGFFVLTSVVNYMLESVDEIVSGWSSYLKVIEAITTSYFTIELIIFLNAAQGKLKDIFTWENIIDFLSI